MTQDLLGTRGKALEDAFFVKQDAELRRRLAESPVARERRQAIADITGLSDPTIIEALSRLDIPVKLLAGIALVPLVLVAWADGSVDARERKAVMQAAAEIGLKQGGVGYELLDAMLAEKPGPELRQAWEGYIAVLTEGMDHADRRALQGPLLDRARRVALSSGGFLGIGMRVSDEEEKVLADLAKAFRI